MMCYLVCGMMQWIHNEGWIRRGVVPWYNVRSCCDGSSDRSLMVDPLSYFSFQPVVHDWWCNKDRGMMCYPVCGMMHIK